MGSIESLVTANTNWANAYPGSNFENEKVFGMGDATGVFVLDSSESGNPKMQSLNKASAIYVEGTIVYKQQEIPVPGSKFLDKGMLNVLKITCDK